MQEHNIVNSCSPDISGFFLQNGLPVILQPVPLPQSFLPHIVFIALCTAWSLSLLHKVTLNLNSILHCVWRIPSYIPSANLKSIFHILLPKSLMRISRHIEISWTSLHTSLHFDSKPQGLSRSGVPNAFAQNLHFFLFDYVSLFCVLKCHLRQCEKP